MKKFAAMFGAMLAGGAATADPVSEVMFSHKHWEVEIVAFDDGSFACLAEVDAVNDSFTVWTYADQTVKLQFYSSSWEFGEGDTADLSIQIDRRGPWAMSNAELYLSSVFFTLPDSNDGQRFLVEVAQGNRLNLRTEAGEDVMWYSLAGSKASMLALIECGEVIAGGNPSNPFN